MPLVCREDLTVINGIGRLEMLAEKGAAFAPVVFVTDQEAEFARAMMNLLSMDFDIHTRYADMLRFNSFRRARRVRRELGNGFIFATHGAKPCKDLRHCARPPTVPAGSRNTATPSLISGPAT